MVSTDQCLAVASGSDDRFGSTPAEIIQVEMTKIIHEAGFQGVSIIPGEIILEDVF